MIKYIVCIYYSYFKLHIIYTKIVCIKEQKNYWGCWFITLNSTRHNMFHILYSYPRLKVLTKSYITRCFKDGFRNQEVIHKSFNFRNILDHAVFIFYIVTLLLLVLPRQYPTVDKGLKSVVKQTKATWTISVKNPWWRFCLNFFSFLIPFLGSFIFYKKDTKFVCKMIR